MKQKNWIVSTALVLLSTILLLVMSLLTLMRVERVFLKHIPYMHSSP